MSAPLNIAGVSVATNPDGSLTWVAGMVIDADGCPRCYHPNSSRGKDYLANSNYPGGDWKGILASDGHGKPAIQAEHDPAPGYFVAMTSYEWPEFPAIDPRRYVDASRVPFIVVPPQVRLAPRGIVLGCRGTIKYQGKTIEAVVADVGPHNKIGEASIRAAELLGINSNARNGGVSAKVVTYTIYPGISALVDGVAYELQRA